MMLHVSMLLKPIQLLNLFLVYPSPTLQTQDMFTLS